MRTRNTVVAAVALAALGATPAVSGASSAAATPDRQAAARHVEGTVVSVNRRARTFRLRDAQRGTVTVEVTRRTRFERVAGFARLRAGLTRIEATLRRANGAWVATAVERSGGGGRHGGGGSDD
jgi:shikimate kinase